MKLPLTLLLPFLLLVSCGRTGQPAAPLYALQTTDNVVYEAVSRPPLLSAGRSLTQPSAGQTVAFGIRLQSAAPVTYQKLVLALREGSDPARDRFVADLPLSQELTVGHSILTLQSSYTFAAAGKYKYFVVGYDSSGHASTLGDYYPSFNVLPAPNLAHPAGPAIEYRPVNQSPIVAAGRNFAEPLAGQAVQFGVRLQGSTPAYYQSIVLALRDASNPNNDVFVADLPLASQITVNQDTTTLSGAYTFQKAGQYKYFYIGIAADGRRTALGGYYPSFTVRAGAPAQGAEPTEPMWTGVNLSGAEFHAEQLPGQIGQDYVYPSSASLSYFASKGMNTVRLPFLWERLQPSLYGAFDPGEQARLLDTVKKANQLGLRVILDPHNYGRYRGNTVGSAAVPSAAFAQFWKELATVFRGHSQVVFGLMNEPHDLDTATWFRAANAALAAIRSSGSTQTVLVPGNRWTGAHSWLNTDKNGISNAEGIKLVQDPAHNMLIEVHQYLDADSSGMSAECLSPSVGSERLKALTGWLKQNGYQAFLGEFAGGNTPTCRAAVTEMLGTLKNNADVWTGWNWWASGPWWGDYMFSLEPGGPADKPQMTWLTPFMN